jgi:four helix bundle protein
VENISKSEAPQELGPRTKRFALRIIRLYKKLPKSFEAEVIGKQLLRSGTSVGAHYHEGVHARSNAEFISKLEVAIQELSETRYWIELLAEAEIVKPHLLEELQNEISELIAILVTVVKNTKKRKNRP